MTSSKRSPRSVLAAAFGVWAALAGAASAQSTSATNFPDFVAGLRAEAIARGLSNRTVDNAFAAIAAPDADVIGRIAKQGEFTRPVWDYLIGAVTPGRINRGRALASRLSSALDRIEARTGVSRWIILAFWGIESDFGTSPGTIPTVRALTTLAYAGHKAANFREEVLSSLQIIDRGDIAFDRMKGSWAGAMGQVQFLPSVYLKYGVDFDGDGRADIWGSETDSLYSVGNYLQRIGWNTNLSWGYEVTLPKDFDLARYRGELSEFARRGVKRTDGGAFPVQGEASVFLPGGAGGPVFLITDNFEVIRTYNTSDSYALAVGHLADRLAGAPALAAPWPTSAPRLDRDGVTSLQAELAHRGFYKGDRDGRAGPKLREAVRQYQISAGLTPDGFASPALLEHVKPRP